MTPQPLTKKAMQKAATNGCHILLVGGTLENRRDFAKKLVALLPPLSASEAQELRENYRAMGLELGASVARPLRTPHESISNAGLCGSRSLPTPGEAALAHAGVLLLANAPRFRKSTLAALAAVLETGGSPAKGHDGPVLLPSRCTVVAGQDTAGHLEKGPLASLLQPGRAVCFSI